MEITLVIVIMALLAYIAFKEYLVSKERAKLLNAVIAKNGYEAASMDLADKIKAAAPQPQQSDLIAEQDLTDEEWEKVNGLKSV